MRGVKTHKHDTIDVMDLRCLVALADQVTTQNAAKVLGVTQPLVVYRIQHIENRLQNQVYLRHAKHDHLTPAGKLLVERARAVLREYDQFVALVKEYRSYVDTSE